MQIGTYNGTPCLISPSSPNHHVLITGLSGGGKSVRQTQIELDSAKNGSTVIVIDISRNHLPQFLLPEIAEEYENHTNRINVATDGLHLHLLSPLQNERLTSLINSSCDILSAGMKNGLRQKAIIRKALEQAISEAPDNLSESQILNLIFRKNSADARWASVFEKLYPVLNDDLLKHGNSNIIPSMINIFDFRNIDISTAEILSEMLLSYLWREATTMSSTSIICSIDEFQHLRLGKNSTLRTVLREGRRFGLHLLLATQTLEIFTPSENAMLNQCATRLIFKPSSSELHKLAKQIAPDNVSEAESILRSLPVGSCLALGDKLINGTQICKPLILQ